nr:hypothetical protein BaRGS_024479 [Batillaria attramentaria]
MTLLGERLKTLREKKKSKVLTLEKLKNACVTEELKNKYTYAISSIKTLIYKLNACTGKVMKIMDNLEAENFFGAFQDLDPSGSGILRPDDVPKAIASACELIGTRLDKDRLFFMHTSKAKVYPMQPLEHSSPHGDGAEHLYMTPSFVRYITPRLRRVRDKAPWISTQSSPTGSVDRINTSTPVKSGSPGGAVGGLDFSLDSVDDEDQDKEEENMGPLDMSSGDIDVFPDPVESERGLAAVGSVSQPGGAEEGAAGAE